MYSTVLFSTYSSKMPKNNRATLSATSCAGVKRYYYCPGIDSTAYDKYLLPINKNAQIAIVFVVVIFALKKEEAQRSAGVEKTKFVWII